MVGRLLNGNETFRIWEKTAPTPDYPGIVKLSEYYQKETPTVYEWRHYDGFNQLSRINQDGEEITYQYRGDGLRYSAQVRKVTESQGKTNLYCWDGSDIVAEQTDGEQIKSYLRGINLIAGEFDRVVYYYILNEHGYVTQLWSQSGACKASYEYDAFGVERNSDKEDENPFRYCGEYFDSSSGTYYMRNRYYDPFVGRFTQADIHWNTGNMIYGDNPVKWNEREAGPNDPLGLNTYTYVPDILAIMQSGNLYAYCINNPIKYIDPFGLKAGDTVTKDNPPDAEDGYNAPKGGPVWDEKGRGWKDKNGNVWVPVPDGHPSAHGGGHWDVQNKNGNGYVNKYPGGAERKGDGQRPNIPKPPIQSSDVGKAVGTGLAVGVVAWGIWTVVKWGVAIATAPVTGGGSLVLAGVTP